AASAVFLMNSVTQSLGPHEFDALAKTFRRLLKPGGLLVVGDVIPRKVSALADAQALLRLGRQQGFFCAAVRGVCRTYFSTYWRLRNRVGLSRYDSHEIAAK